MKLLAFVKKLAQERDVWKRCRPHIKDDALSKEQRYLLQQVDAYWNANPTKTTCTLPDFEGYFFGVRATHLKTAELGVYRAAFSQMEKASDADAEQILEHYIRQDYLAQIQQKLFAAATDPDFEIDAIGTVVHEYNKELGRALHLTDVFVTGETASPKLRPPGFRFKLKELDLACGEIAQGDFVILGARPEMGKTSFVADNVGHMAQQPVLVDRPVIWVNNEERSDKVFRRVVQSVLGITTSDLLANYDACLIEFHKKISEKRLLIVKQGECNNVRALDLLFEEHNPCLIIIDQLDKVSGFSKSERDDLRLGALYGWARGVAARFGPVIAVSQLDAEAEGQSFPGFERLRGSKTDKQGEADLIIILSAMDGDRASPYRTFHTPKNKLDGADELHRHGKWEVPFDRAKGQYQTVMK